jgi:Mn-containing catalase
MRRSARRHAYAFALKKFTGVDIETMLPTPNISLDKIPESRNYLAEGSHRRPYRFSPSDYKEMSGIKATRRRTRRDEQAADMRLGLEASTAP